MQIPTVEQIDTICAISTAPGRGGIAVARVSGPSAIAVADNIWRGKPLADAPSHTARLGDILGPDGSLLDRGVATVFRGPRSYTGEDIVEISVHGSTYIQQQLLDSLCRAGARMAGPGEFTRRAFLNGRLDLAEAEAVADIIASSSRAAHRLAVTQLQGRFSHNIDTLRQRLVDLAALLELELDFSEEDVTFADRTTLRTLATEIRDTVGSLASTFAAGQALRDGIPVAIIGRPNVGKSRLLNTLLGTDRAIVSDIPGTTRDTVEDTIDIDGHTIRFIDTAGIRHTDDTVEALGIERTMAKTATARVIIWLISPDEADLPTLASRIAQSRQPDSHLIAVLSKSDLLPDPDAATGRLSMALRKTDNDAHPGTPAHDDHKAASRPGADTVMAVSALTGQGIDTLRDAILRAAIGELPADESLIVTNARHHAALIAAAQSLDALLQGLDTGLTPDLLAQHLRQSIDHLAAITGAITSHEILTTIFTRFCIGK